VVYNDAHSPARVRSDLAHEAAHLIAEHELNSGWMTDDTCTGGGAPQEKEAIELAGVLLVPRGSAKVLAIRGGSPLVLASLYGVSVEMATSRMRVSGGAIIAERSRKRRASLPS
jgi:Zn-dependent peptidase ImmA (M78 family)